MKSLTGKLTRREGDCLLLAAKGKSIKETAEVMQVKPSTVKTWRKKIIKKLACVSITQAVYQRFSCGGSYDNT